MHKLVCLNIK